MHVITPGTPKAGLRSGWRHLLVFCAAVLVIFSRRPDALLHAQFYAEDGRIWFANAYNLGCFRALLHPQDGYFQTLPRLAAGLALLVPLALAPLATNLVGIVVQAFPVNLLLSSKCAVWGTVPFRAAMGATYLLLPNSREVNVSVTEAQWHLALIAFLLVIAPPPARILESIAYISVLALSATTGPFCFVLLPIAFVFWYVRRDNGRWLPCAVLTTGSLLQATALCLLDAHARSNGAPLGASVEWFARILAGQIYMEALIGSNVYSILWRAGLIAMVALAGSMVVVYCWTRSNLEFRSFLVFAGAIFAASLLSPVVNTLNGHTKWQILAGTPGVHYWFLPTLGFVWCLVWCTKTWRLGSIPLLSLMCAGMMRDFLYPAYPDMHFERYAYALTAAASGTTMMIPENPPGWTLSLLKR